MGSNTNFKNFSDTPTVPGSLGLARQSSVYSLTFEEFQNTMGGLGKDFGSMNMDELLKSIWSAEETQILASNVGVGTGLGGVPCGNLQRQGSITLPRTLSQKTVDEVWRDLAKEGNNSTGVSAGPNMPQRQQTLGEITLEEFLVRAGIAREDASQTQLIGRPSSNNNTDTNNPAFGLLNDNGAVQMSHSGLNQPPVLPLSFCGARTSQQQHQVFTKPPAGSGFAPAMHLVSNAQLASSGARQASQAALAGLSQSALSPAPLVRTRGVGSAGVTVASPASHLSPVEMVKAGLDLPATLSPVPYMFNRRGKCSAALEKVIERRQKRMIKNRESAARSRARKQAYTMELEAEVAKLKEINDELQRKQEEILEMQKNQILESMNQQWGSKRQCLRRTFTGPW